MALSQLGKSTKLSLSRLRPVRRQTMFQAYTRQDMT